MRIERGSFVHFERPGGDARSLALAARKRWSREQFFHTLRGESMSSAYRYPARGHVYRHCVMCRRPFRVCNSQLARRSARSCTVRCYHAALLAFSEALASDRLELILGRAPRRQQAPGLSSRSSTPRAWINSPPPARSATTASARGSCKQPRPSPDSSRTISSDCRCSRNFSSPGA